MPAGLESGLGCQDSSDDEFEIITCDSHRVKRMNGLATSNAGYDGPSDSVSDDGSATKPRPKVSKLDPKAPIFEMKSYWQPQMFTGTPEDSKQDAGEAVGVPAIHNRTDAEVHATTVFPDRLQAPLIDFDAAERNQDVVFYL